MDKELVEEFLGNLEIEDREQIDLRYGEITRALNKKFRGTESTVDNSIKVGSYGRETAIKGLSDLDMLYIMPATDWEKYKNGRQLALLQACKSAIESRYSSTAIRCDRQVVVVTFTNFEIEVLPAFEQEDGSFKFPDTYDGGYWCVTKPLSEIRAIDDADAAKNANLRRLCKMARAWRNKHGVAMGGLLVDTLAHNFLQSTKDYDKADKTSCDVMCRDFFQYLADLEHQDYYLAPGSRQYVYVKKKFRRKAKKALELCNKAIDAEETNGYHKKWKKVFGRPFPGAAQEVREAVVAKAAYTWTNTEEFIEDKHPVDIRYNLEIDCEVLQDGFREHTLRDMLRKAIRLKPQKSLTFSVTEIDVPKPYRLEWKVLNRGEIARQKNMVRGQIVPDSGHMRKDEKTSFQGEHIVECYAIRNGVVVAKDRIEVPIQ